MLTVINSVVVVPIIILLIKNIFLLLFYIIFYYIINYKKKQQGCDAVVRMEASSLGYNMACKCGVRIEQLSLIYCAYHNVWATHI